MNKTEVIKTAEKHGLYLEETSLKHEGMGLDFEVVFGMDAENQQWVLRFPRREDAINKVRQEKRILDFIQSNQSTFQVPNWEIFTEELIAYKKLDGVPAVTANPETHEEHWMFDKEEVPESYISSLAKTLVALHNLPIENGVEAGLKHQTADELRQIMSSRIEKVRNEFKVSEDLLKRWKKWIEDEEMWPKKTGVIHGNLFPGHTLVDNNHSVTGVIDWTEAKISDISNDFTAYYLLFGEESMKKFLSAYEEFGGYTWPRMEEHIVELLSTQAITIAEFALSSGLEDYYQAAGDMLKPS